MTYKTVKDYFERKPNASYLFFACMIFLFRVFLNWYGNDAQLVTLLDVIWTLMMTAGFFGIFQNPGDINIVEGTGEGSERVIKILPLVFGIIGIQNVAVQCL